jgi:uncharacterized RDD family membrane protein YckC
VATPSNCSNCRSPLSTGLRICPACGQRQQVAASNSLGLSPLPLASAHIPYQLNPVGFWHRAGAFVIDLVILIPIVTVGQQFMPVVAGLICWWLYFALFESSGWHATPGKRIRGIEVTDINGVHLRFGRATLRFAGRLLSTAPLFLGFLLAAFTQNKQTLHDLIASTLVIKSR